MSTTKYASRVVLEMTDTIGEYITVKKIEHEYSGAWALACGPSSQEQALASNSANLSQTMANDFSTRFANQDAVLSQLKSSLSPIAAAGPGQHGFTSPELSAMQTQAINNAGAANKNAMQAARTFGSGQGGGGTSGITSGITKQVEGSIASQAAQNEGNQLNQITQADYNQGSNNFWRAQGGLQALSGQYNPESFGNLSISSNQNAFGQADKIQSENNAREAAIAGGITSLGKSALGFATGGISNLGDGGWDTSAFLKGGMEGLGNG